jgi:hypothetical protein
VVRLSRSRMLAPRALLRSKIFTWLFSKSALCWANHGVKHSMQCTNLIRCTPLIPAERMAIGSTLLLLNLRHRLEVCCYTSSSKERLLVSAPAPRARCRFRHALTVVEHVFLLSSMKGRTLSNSVKTFRIGTSGCGMQTVPDDSARPQLSRMRCDAMRCRLPPSSPSPVLLL